MRFDFKTQAAGEGIDLLLIPNPGRSIKSYTASQKKGTDRKEAQKKQKNL